MPKGSENITEGDKSQVELPPAQTVSEQRKTFFDQHMREAKTLLDMQRGLSPEQQKRLLGDVEGKINDYLDYEELRKGGGFSDDDIKLLASAENPYNFMSMSAEEKQKLYELQTRAREIKDGRMQDVQEQSPEEEVTTTIGKLNAVDRNIFEARRSIAAAERKLTAMREELGASSPGEKSPSAGIQNERLQKLEEERRELFEEKEKWIEEHGRENLPEGVALESGEDGREARAGSPEERQLTEDEKREEEEAQQEELEARKVWLKHWEEQATRDFEKAMRDDWRTSDAVNLELTIELMKMRVPKAMDKKAEDFTNGKLDTPPFSTVWIRWEARGLLDRLVTGGPNQIKKLEITFDEDREEIVKEDELIKKEEEGEGASQDVVDDAPHNPAENKTEDQGQSGGGAAA